MGRVSVWVGVVLAVALGACSAPPPPPTEVFWGQRQVLFRLDASGTRVDVLGLRGGITPLGQVVLPPDFRGERLVLDGVRGVVTVFGGGEEIEVDARGLTPIHRWQRLTASAGRMDDSKP